MLIGVKLSDESDGLNKSSKGQLETLGSSHLPLVCQIHGWWTPGPPGGDT